MTAVPIEEQLNKETADTILLRSADSTLKSIRATERR
jgi:hypothetical protein